MLDPLAGTKVMDVTSAAAGPFTTALLGQLGAEVIRIEPPTGDRMHRERKTRSYRTCIPVGLSRQAVRQIPRPAVSSRHRWGMPSCRDPVPSHRHRHEVV